MAGYDPKAIESRWQQVWAAEKTWEVANPGQPGFEADKPKSYVLEMLPYPSGEPASGHLKCYAVGDAIAHFRRRRGCRWSTRWATTPSACRPRTTPSRPASRRAR